MVSLSVSSWYSAATARSFESWDLAWCRQNSSSPPPGSTTRTYACAPHRSHRSRLVSVGLVVVPVTPSSTVFVGIWFRPGSVTVPSGPSWWELWRRAVVRCLIMPAASRLGETDADRAVTVGHGRRAPKTMSSQAGTGLRFLRPPEPRSGVRPAAPARPRGAVDARAAVSAASAASVMSAASMPSSAPVAGSGAAVACGCEPDTADARGAGAAGRSAPAGAGPAGTGSGAIDPDTVGVGVSTPMTGTS